MKELAIAIRNGNQDNYKEIIDNIKKAGFKNVFIQWYNDNEKLQKEIYDYVKKSNLNIIFSHLGYQNSNALWLNGIEGDNELDRYIKDINIIKKLGINLVIMHLTNEYDNPGCTNVGLKRIKKLVEEAEKIGIKLAFENVELKGYLEFVIENIKSNNVGICFDSGHCSIYFDSEFNTDFFKNKVFAIHLHDNFKKNDDHYLPFDGMINWDKVIKQLKEMNYNKYLTMECGYCNYYSNISIEEYYKKAYEVGKKLIDKINDYKESE